MPALPAPFIHLLGVLRPRLLRPDVRVASIAYVDFAGLKRAGFNAVVIDKDNCVTIPHADGIFPAYANAWRTLLQTFPGRVLVVSNSAGSAKDRGGIGAESLSMSLRAPVLAHRRPKPACARDILDFFSGKTSPRTLRNTEMARLAAAERAEDSAEAQMIAKWRGEVDNGPLCGPLRERDLTLEEKMIAAQARKPAVAPAPSAAAPPAAFLATPTHSRTPASSASSDPLRILVIGDRKFTDTLQARELDALLTASPFPATLSIQTTDLPQPNDVRSLRILEDWLAGPNLAHNGQAGGVDWTSYISSPPPPPPVPTWKETQRARVDQALERLNPVNALLAADSGPPITWDPRSWRPRPVAAAVLSASASAAAYLSTMTWRGLKAGAAAAYVRGSAWVKAKVAEVREERKRRAVEAEKARAEEEAKEDAAEKEREMEKKSKGAAAVAGQGTSP